MLLKIAIVIVLIILMNNIQSTFNPFNRTIDRFDDEGYPLPSSLIDPRDCYYEYDNVRLQRSLHKNTMCRQCH